MSAEHDNTELAQIAEFSMRMKYRDYFLENGFADPNQEGTDDLRLVSTTAVFFEMISHYARSILPEDTDEHTISCYVHDLSGALTNEPRKIELDIFSRITHPELALHYFCIRYGEDIEYVRASHATSPSFFSDTLSDEHHAALTQMYEHDEKLLARLVLTRCLPHIDDYVKDTEEIVSRTQKRTSSLIRGVVEQLVRDGLTPLSPDEFGTTKTDSIRQCILRCQIL